MAEPSNPMPSVNAPSSSAGAIATEIVGSASPLQPTFFSTAVLVGDGATIAGFRIENDATDPTTKIAVWMHGAQGATVRNDTIVDGDIGLLVDDGATDAVIAGNAVTGHASSGLLFAVGGVGSRVEGNTLTDNGIGVEFDSAGGDLGGGRLQRGVHGA